jgi:hypothetical protein
MATVSTEPLRALEDNEYYLAGAYSPSIDYNLTHLVITPQYPTGRLTKDIRQAWDWAHEDALQFNQDEKNPQNDWLANVTIGTNPFEQVDIKPERIELLGAE